AYAALVGLSLSGIFLVYTGESIARVFFISAATFGATSLYGYSTRADLSRFGSFLFMGLIGIIIAGFVNLFLVSSALQFVVSVIGVLVFTGLIAYDTQRIKRIYIAGEEGEIAGKKAIMGALALYLDFL
ncbi:Bax inhibitor-1/YccA family protein, partial [Burkholderia gladioli]